MNQRCNHCNRWHWHQGNKQGPMAKGKWFVKKKGYLKIHVAVNTKTREILALEVTDEKVRDGKMMCRLVSSC